MLETSLLWYWECKTAHLDCWKDESAKLPTRLLDIRDTKPSGLIYLTDETRSGQYAALSYVWGGLKPPPSAVTLVCNKADRERGVVFTDFPQCYQDAVRVAQKLELSYLWIDALCIIQDDKADWDRESAAMDEIFSHAAVVIIAAAASNVIESFLYRSKQISQPPKGFNGVMVRQSRDHIGQDYDACADSAIDIRGWCYQERHMARRCLIFRPDEAVWECATECHCECALFQKTGYQSRLI